MVCRQYRITLDGDDCPRHKAAEWSGENTPPHGDRHGSFMGMTLAECMTKVEDIDE
jgi:hypothetical protein